MENDVIIKRIERIQSEATEYKLRTKTLRAQGHRIFLRGLKSLIDHAQAHSIEAKWLYDLYLQEHPIQAQNIIDAASREALLDFVDMLYKFGSSKEQAFKAVAKWTGNSSPSTISKYYYQLQKIISNDITSIPRSEIEEQQLYNSARVFYAQQKINNPFPEDYKKALQAYKALKRKIEELDFDIESNHLPIALNRKHILQT